MGGYLQKLLRVDLSRGEISEESFGPALLSQYIGGWNGGISETRHFQEGGKRVWFMHIYSNLIP